MKYNISLNGRQVKRHLLGTPTPPPELFLEQRSPCAMLANITHHSIEFLILVLLNVPSGILGNLTMLFETTEDSLDLKTT